MDFTLNNLLNASINWLFPHQCTICKTTSLSKTELFCSACYPTLPFRPSTCHQCGQQIIAGQDYCGPCLTNPPYFDHCFCPFSYSGEIKSLIQDFKYHDKPELAHLLAHLLIKELKDHDIELPELLIPTPSHISRLRSRGYNQSLLLSQKLSVQLAIPMSTDSVIKHKKTHAQANLSTKQRLNNIKNCFQIKHPIQAKSVAIIDDVVTTGATVNEIAKILKKNGVDYIQIWGLSHTE